MNKYADTHCHLDMIAQRKDYGDLQSVIEDFPEDLGLVVHVACEVEAWSQVDSICQQDSRIVFSAGLHPHDARLYNQAHEDTLLEISKHPKFRAWGECGLDYHYDYSPRDVQQKVFSRQLELSLPRQLPVIVHTREADSDTLAILREHLTQDSRLHIHCYTGSSEFAEKLLQLPGELFFGFTGVLTFPGAQSVRDAAKVIPADKLLTETDGPFMAPVPWRGKSAHPKMIPSMVEKLAELHCRNTDEMYKQLMENTKTFYGTA